MGVTAQEACDAVGITDRTYRNWKKLGDEDGRTKRTAFQSVRRIAEATREAIVERFCKADVSDLSLPQAFYKLLDEKQEYHCSLSTLYRIFAAKGLSQRRAPMRGGAISRRRIRQQTPTESGPGTSRTFARASIRGAFTTSTSSLTLTAVTSSPRAFMKRITTSALGPFVGHGVRPGTLAIHSDNGASMKAASTQALGVKFSHSRPRTWKRNRLSEPACEAVM